MCSDIKPQQFQRLLLRWFDSHGRKHLPWQENKTPYRVWISEIMLQQTQVSTVIPYYQRFMQRFPDVLSLANAHEDDVLLHWAGLGYYSRARNLHRAAKMVVQTFKGKFPDNLTDLMSLPGIGQSTAGAILSIAFNHPTAILDGNVKRVLARFHAITEPVNHKLVENTLWELASKYTPSKRVADYTQAMMDLGATLCTRSKPACNTCPLVKHCRGYQLGISASLPKKKVSKKLPVRQATFLLLKKHQRILLVKRPAKGIWGGLWSLPEIAGEVSKQEIRLFCRQHYQAAVNHVQALAAFRHTFSHYHLDITPVVVEVASMPGKIMEADEQIWYNPSEPEEVGLPRPVQKILGNI